MQVFFKRINWIITWVTICILEKEFANAVLWSYVALTHWGRMTHICVSKLTTFGSNNGLAPGRRQAIIWTNAGILLIQTLGTNFSEILRKIYTFSFKKMHMKMSSGNECTFIWRGLCEFRGSHLRLANAMLTNHVPICCCARYCIIKHIPIQAHISLSELLWVPAATCA